MYSSICVVTPNETYFVLGAGGRALIIQEMSEKSTNVHPTRPNGCLAIHLDFVFWTRENVQVCIFAREDFVFPLRRHLSVALLLLLHVLKCENSSKIQRS